MTEQNRVLVTGATGNVGRHVASRLLNMGIAVRALTRDPGSAALPDGVEAVRGDLSAPDGWQMAMHGVGAVFLMWPFHSAEPASAILDAIGEHAGRLVLLSSGAVRDGLAPERHADPVGRSHSAVERAVERSGLEWTILRPSTFAANTLWWAPQIHAGNVVRGAYGAVPMTLLHERDIAAVAVRALTGDGHAGARYALTGPEVLTQAEQVRVIGEVIGSPLRWEELSREAERRRLLADDDFPDTFVDALLDGYAKMLDAPPPAVNATVEEVTGTPARTFREWVFDHAGDFRPSAGTADDPA